MVVVVLVCVWIAVLTPRVVRYFREDRAEGSIESFHQQLHLLERTGPKLVAPAHTLETAYASSASGAPPVDAPWGRPDLVLVDSLTPSAGPPTEHGSWISGRARADRRRRGRRRRRDILLGLVAVAVLSGGLGAMRGLHLLWAATGAALVLAAGFVALAAYAQLLDVDRQANRPVERGVRTASGRWQARPRHVLAAGDDGDAGVALVGGALPWAARAGYPGAWDDEPEEPAGRRAAAGG